VYIAHIRKDSNECQSVAEHSLNTANLAAELCSIDELKTAAYLAGLLHDAGKYTFGFKKYILKANDDPSSVRKGEVSHSASGAYLISELSDLMNTTEYFAVELIREAIISHHGLYDCVEPDGTISYYKRIEKESQIANIKNEVLKYISCEELTNNFLQTVAELNTLINKILLLIRSEKAGKLGSKHFYFGMSERMLMSLLIDADRVDTTCFMDRKLLPQVMSKQEFIEMWDRLSVNLEESLKGFKITNDIDLYRKEISDACLKAAEISSGIFRLVVPTGAGKTLSSLRYALHHAKRYGKRHIIYIAPYNSILEQNAEVIRNVLRENTLILEHHCNIVMDEEGDNARYKELTANWDAPVIITSAVQFLETLFSSKTSSVRRMHTLADSVIIIDEIQSLPIKCISLFNLAANYLVKICNSSIVLCSATQPLLDLLPENSLSKPHDMIENIQVYSDAFKRTVIDPTNAVGNYLDINSLADFTLEKLNDHRNALVIVNTKTCARNLYIRLNEMNKAADKDKVIELFHLSTNMCAAHRKEVLNSVRDCLAKKKKMICISTQLIEAGVDISFETVIRSLAGLDSIVQAAGRCNRNCERRLGKVYIVKIAEEDVSNLIDIKKAQDAMNTILYTYQTKPELLDNDLLSKKAMDMYYTAYFLARIPEMDYSVPKLDTSIVKLLSDNPIGTNSLVRKNGGQKTKLILRQAYKTAGDCFEVIPEEGLTDIVVEYNDESRELISQMNSDISIEKQIHLLRKLQQYSVSIPEQLKKRLNHALFNLKNGGIVALRKENYSMEVGVCETPSKMEPYFL